MDQNRYEETPEKVNPFVKAMKGLGTYFKNVGLNFIQGFKYNIMKIPAILIAVPGIFLGFFLTYHSEVVRGITFEGTKRVDNTDGTFKYVTTYFNGISLNISAILLFVLMLCGIINLFNCLGVSGKRNLGSVLKCTAVTVLMCACAALYLFYVFTFMGNEKEIMGASAKSVINSSWYISIASVIVSCVCSLVGCILGFIWYDRTYEKIDR